jgi:hypothetical protein
MRHHVINGSGFKSLVSYNRCSAIKESLWKKSLLCFMDCYTFLTKYGYLNSVEYYNKFILYSGRMLKERYVRQRPG